ncbi:MAG: DUF6431 domain-containing protein [Firmicutes bacterium]|nr:DUF6431 domain-containing protein [Bacillota bacterium]
MVVKSALSDLRMDSHRDFATVEQLYRTFLTTLVLGCPQCGHPRERHSWRARWVVWAPGCWDRLALLRLRCRICHTVETCFPPWLIPYDPAATWLLVTLGHAVAIHGQSWAQVERAGAWPHHWLRRHVGRWLAAAPRFRQLIVQQYGRRGAGRGRPGPPRGGRPRALATPIGRGCKWPGPGPRRVWRRPRQARPRWGTARPDK